MIRHPPPNLMETESRGLGFSLVPSLGTCRSFHLRLLGSWAGFDVWGFLLDKNTPTPWAQAWSNPEVRARPLASEHSH